MNYLNLNLKHMNTYILYNLHMKSKYLKKVYNLVIYLNIVFAVTGFPNER